MKKIILLFISFTIVFTACIKVSAIEIPSEKYSSHININFPEGYEISDSTSTLFNPSVAVYRNNLDSIADNSQASIIATNEEGTSGILVQRTTRNRIYDFIPKSEMVSFALEVFGNYEEHIDDYESLDDLEEEYEEEYIDFVFEKLETEPLVLSKSYMYPLRNTECFVSEYYIECDTGIFQIVYCDQSNTEQNIDLYWDKNDIGEYDFKINMVPITKQSNNNVNSKYEDLFGWYYTSETNHYGHENVTEVLSDETISKKNTFIIFSLVALSLILILLVIMRKKKER